MVEHRILPQVLELLSVENRNEQFFWRFAVDTVKLSSPPISLSELEP
ncbi:unnamed protein product, partial [Rotaria sp. Silwood2]